MSSYRFAFDFHGFVLFLVFIILSLQNRSFPFTVFVINVRVISVYFSFLGFSLMRKERVSIGPVEIKACLSPFPLLLLRLSPSPPFALLSWLGEHETTQVSFFHHRASITRQTVKNEGRKD